MEKSLDQQVSKLFELLLIQYLSEKQRMITKIRLIYTQAFQFFGQSCSWKFLTKVEIIDSNTNHDGARLIVQSGFKYLR